MDLISAFKSELFRPLSTIIVPGTFALAPWLLLIFIKSPEIYSFLDNHPAVSTALFIILTTAAGFLLENIGARIERLWDNIISSEDKNHLSKWDEYLQLATKDEIVGQRYLRTIVIRMKFELAFAPAVLIGLIGMLFINCSINYWTWISFIFWFLLGLALAGYLIFESFTSANIAAKARNIVINSVNQSSTK